VLGCARSAGLNVWVVFCAAHHHCVTPCETEL